MLNLPYEKQLAIKQKKLTELLGKYGKIEKIIGMENPKHYRNKVHAAFGFDKNKGIISGIYQPESHKIVPVSACAIEDETADAIINTIRQMMPEYKITAYDERKCTGFLRHVLVKRSFSTGEIMVVLVVTDPVFKLQKHFVKALTDKYPNIKSIILNINDRFTPVVLGRQEKLIYGRDYIEDELCGLTFRISAKSFYQINPVQTEVLYNTAIEFAELTGKEYILDAYCGTGTIGLTASKYAEKAAGVEINRDAVKDAIANAKANGIKNCWFTCADAGDYMEEMTAAKEKCDVVFMDPPRSGSDEKFIASLLKLAPKKIVYISCNPETLARDLELICKSKYKVQKIQPVDMFPHTNHVETVVQLVRKKPDTYLDVDIDLSELDVTASEAKATYREIKDYILEKHGVKVSSLYIAQIKEKNGIIERECYNKPKSDESKQPQCPLEKEKLITEALKHFQMI